MDQQSPFPLSFRDLSEFLPVCSEPVDGGGDEEEDSDEAAATTKRRFLKWEECWTQVITDKGPCYTTAVGKYEGIGTNFFLDLFKLKLICILASLSPVVAGSGEASGQSFGLRTREAWDNEPLSEVRS